MYVWIRVAKLRPRVVPKDLDPISDNSFPIVGNVELLDHDSKY